MKAQVLTLLPLLFLSCGDKDEVDDSAGDTDDAELQWYTTCGDPSCQGYTGPFEGVDICDDEVEGAPCVEGGTQCDPQDDCNAFLMCASEDPKDQQGGCPISRKRHKKTIRYLETAEIEAARDALLSMPLATWRYRWEDDRQPLHLGFLIDDVPGSPAVRPDGEHVDLYGYTSLTVAAVQAQQAEIELLRAELAALRAEVQALRAEAR